MIRAGFQKLNLMKTKHVSRDYASICNVQKGINMKNLTLNCKGRDSWSRPVYEAEGILYVDVNPHKDRRANICTKYNNEFDGEPDMPISEDIQIEFIPYRDIWD